MPAKSSIAEAGSGTGAGAGFGSPVSDTEYPVLIP